MSRLLEEWEYPCACGAPIGIELVYGYEPARYSLEAWHKDIILYKVSNVQIVQNYEAKDIAQSLMKAVKRHFDDGPYKKKYYSECGWDVCV